jgi:hypothetical protein
VTVVGVPCDSRRGTLWQSSGYLVTVVRVPSPEYWYNMITQSQYNSHGKATEHTATALALLFTSFTMLTQNLRHFSNLRHIYFFLIQSFNTYKKFNMTVLSVQLRTPFFQLIMYVWTMYLWKLLKNQWVTGIYMKWFHHTVLSFAPRVTCCADTVMTGTESTLHVTQCMSVAYGAWNLTLPHNLIFQIYVAPNWHMLVQFMWHPNDTCWCNLCSTQMTHAGAIYVAPKRRMLVQFM